MKYISLIFFIVLCFCLVLKGNDNSDGDSLTNQKEISRLNRGEDQSLSFYDDNGRLLSKADSIGKNLRFKGYALQHGWSRDLPFQCFMTNYDENGYIISTVWMIYDDSIDGDCSLEIEETKKYYSKDGSQLQAPKQDTVNTNFPPYLWKMK